MSNDIQGSTSSFLTKLSYQLGVNNIDNNSIINIYPNPSNDKITLTGAIENLNLVEIFDITGQTIISENTPIPMIDISTLKNGTYIIQIKTEDQNFRKKIEVVR